MLYWWLADSSNNLEQWNQGDVFMLDTGILQGYGWPCWVQTDGVWGPVNGGNFRNGNVNNFDPVAALDFWGFTSQRMSSKTIGFYNLERNIVDPPNSFSPDWAGCEPFMNKLNNEVRRRFSGPMGFYDVRDFGAANYFVDFYCVELNSGDFTSIQQTLEIYSALKAMTNNRPCCGLISPGYQESGGVYNFTSASKERSFLATACVNRGWIPQTFPNQGKSPRTDATNIIVWFPAPLAALAPCKAYWDAKYVALLQTR